MDPDPNLLHEQQRRTLGALLEIRYVEVTRERVVASCIQRSLKKITSTFAGLAESFREL